jgi:DNA-nicking Smr family endonuclease
MPRKADPKRDDLDSALWRRAMRDVKPVAPRAAPPPAPAKPAAPRAIIRPEANRPEASLPPLAIDRFAGIDRANAERLKRGKRKIEARLDLHGMTQDEAHRTLLGFVRTARVGGKRCVLVITGRGNFGGGVLKAAVPRWLAEAEFRPHLLAIATAQPRDGGTGALYVMLRRNATDTER